MLTQSPKNMDSFDPFSESSPPASHLSHLQGQASPQNNFFNESNYTPSPILDPFDPFTTPPTLHLSQNPSPISSPQISPQPPALDPFSLTTPIPSSPLCKSEMSSPSTQDTSPFSVSPTSPFISTSPLPPISAPFSTVTPKLPIVLPELLAQELFSAFVIQDQLVKMMVKGQIKAPPEPVPYTVQNPLEWALFPSPSPSVLLRYQHEMEHTALPSLEQFPLQLHVDLQPHSTNLCWNAVLHCAMLPGLALEKITMTCGANSLLTYQGNALTEHTLIPTTFPYPFQFQVDNSSTFIEFQLKWDLPFLISKIGLVHPTGVSFSLKEKCSSSLLVFRYSLTAS
ncbi:hypothetical protein HMI56_005985 [Coelomomyces lativittatus]|nr:hypothetical protein HMI56_005985 [Coelomomyces lativittatus]